MSYDQQKIFTHIRNVGVTNAGVVWAAKAPTRMTVREIAAECTVAADADTSIQITKSGSVSGASTGILFDNVIPNSTAANTEVSQVGNATIEKGEFFQLRVLKGAGNNVQFYGVITCDPNWAP